MPGLARPRGKRGALDRSLKLRHLSEADPFMPAARKIALFGGTFDPIHLGHIELAQTAWEQLGLDEVRFLPCRISPHKQETAPASPSDRLEMLRLATTGLPWAVVDNFELRGDGPSYSWQTAEAMASCYQGARLFWIMGGDQWHSLPQWQHPDRLAACVEFAVASRGEALLPREGYRLHELRAHHPASASAIRVAIANGDTEPSWLNPAVSQWIAARQLYLDRLQK